MSSVSNYQDLLKVMALIIMLIDHAGLYLFDDNQWLRAFSGFVMPVFAFYAGYNFHGYVRHLIWLLGLGLIALGYIVFDKFLPNILISISVGQLYLSYAGKAILQNENRFLKHFLVMIFLTPFTYEVVEYGTQVIAFMQVGYIYAHRKEDKGYLLLSILVLVIFYQYHSVLIKQHVLLGSICILSGIFAAGFLLWKIDHRKTIPINLNLISRNMLHIYSISSIIYIVLAIVRSYKVF